MNDKELINYLWALLMDLITDGNDPEQNDYKKIAKEFYERGIIDEDTVDALFEGWY